VNFLKVDFQIIFLVLHLNIRLNNNYIQLELHNIIIFFVLLQAMSFPSVPFGPNDFGQQCSTASGNIENYGDANQVRNCRLLGLLDLAGGDEYVRGKIADFFNDMLDIIIC